MYMYIYMYIYNYTCTCTCVYVHIAGFSPVKCTSTIPLPFQLRKKARGAAELASSKIRICNHRVSRLCVAGHQPSHEFQAQATPHIQKSRILANKKPEKANQLRVWQKSSARDIKLAQATPPAMFSLITLE